MLAAQVQVPDGVRGLGYMCTYMYVDVHLELTISIYVYNLRS